MLSAFGGAHAVTANAGGVNVSSSTAVAISAPPGTLSLAGLASGGIPGGAVQTGGDLSGTADEAQVTSLAHVAGQDKVLVQAASDSAAAQAGVAVGSLYVNTGVKTGVGVLAVRLA